MVLSLTYSILIVEFSQAKHFCFYLGGPIIFQDPCQQFYSLSYLCHASKLLFGHLNHKLQSSNQAKQQSMAVYKSRSRNSGVT